MKHAVVFAGAALVAVVALFSCVGDDPAAGTHEPADGAAPETGQPGTDAAGPTDGGGGTDAPSNADAADAAPEPATPVAAGLADPYGLAITSQSAVILTIGKLYRCPLKTCLAPAVIADNLDAPAVPPIPRPYMVDADDTSVHWISETAGLAKFFYYRCSVSGCNGQVPTQHPYATEIIGPVGIALGPDGFARFGEKGAVLSCDANTCTTIGGVDVDSTRAFAIDGTSIFYTDTTDPAGTYKATAGTAGSATNLHQTPGHVVAVEGANVYTLTATKILACAKSGCGGIPTAFIENELDLTSMAVGPSGVYWTSNGATATGGIVKTCPLSGCAGGPRIIATGQAKPTSIRLEGGTVYWVNRGTGGATGMLMRAGQ